MRNIIIALALLVSTVAFAQTTTGPANLYAAGASFNQGAKPSVAGNFLYAHAIGDGTYAFSDIDVLPNTLRPFTVTTNIGGGIAQKLFTIGKYSVYVPTTAGVSINGNNTGWNWSTGGMVPVKITKSGWYLLPNARVIKSSVSNGTGFQLIAGFDIGWGK